MLDLFAGSGALGIEALSRGAAAAVFVDRSHKASRPSAPTSRRSGSTPRCARSRRARRSARHPAGARHTIWSSSIPPTGDAAELGRELSEGLTAVLAPGARVVTESDRRAPLELDLPLADERRYGDTVIRIHEP